MFLNTLYIDPSTNIYNQTTQYIMLMQEKI